MKIAVSVPDEIFTRADDLARRTGTSRSALYSRALAEYVDRHAPDPVTEAMDATLTLLDQGIDPFVAETSRRVLTATEW